MPTSAQAYDQRRALTLEQLRTLRLALGTAASLLVSQLYAWPLSFIAPVITVLLLALPLPAPSIAGGVKLVVAMTGSIVVTGVLLLPAIAEYHALGVLLLTLALFWCFYFTASGGPALIGTLATLGLALTAAVGSVSVDAVFLLARALGVSSLVGIVFVWLAHAVLPDAKASDALPPGALKKPPPAKPDRSEARWSAFRSLVIVLPIALWFLFSAASAAYLPVMIKVASMGQETTNEGTRQAAQSLLLSTLYGGIAAVIGWQVLSITPTLSVYVIYVALASLFMGTRIFKGPALAADGDTWSYAALTMLVVLAPAVLDSVGGAPAGAKFWERLIMFAGTAIYAVNAVYVVDAFRPSRSKRS
jgi:hypothetical protein